ncbi:hypothetical protein GCM10025881_36390 [Pseudolysinimonas kribbensis]|uniref:HTH gntR-type domain-containing protein n=1 Tax=Pseudolysinimonas kribbensis TaxID=433641 RepID=A0ABQ6KBE7_9MICO|nr:GntR family transcriptional regulator [Pseudolysinimonas kribbensis]GMA96815.1 hypothetical protein GCM10025881_36390 [Pseudolysinimonas kribbensis]
MATTAQRGTVHLEEVAARLTNGYKTIGEMVYEVIRESIVSGAFAPGERLRQEAIATAIGVSRIPVRSALMQLESEGLVDFHPRRGAVVRSSRSRSCTRSSSCGSCSSRSRSASRSRR